MHVVVAASWPQVGGETKKFKSLFAQLANSDAVRSEARIDRVAS
jgi:hypothetical protein